MSKIVHSYPIIIVFVLAFSLFAATELLCAQNVSKNKIIIIHDQLLPEEAMFLDLVTNAIQQTISDLPVESVNYHHKTIAELNIQIESEAACVLTIGKLALHTVLSTRNSTPIFSTLVDKIELDKQINNYRQFGINLTGIYHEQSFYRQLLLTKAVSPQSKKLLLILGRRTRYSLVDFLQLINLTGFDLTYRILTHQSAAQDFINNQEYKNGSLLILNDEQHYSSKNLTLLLLASYKKQIPMIGSTLKHAKLAAIASVYTSAAQLSKESSTQLNSICHSFIKSPTNAQVKTAGFAKNYQVKVNNDIAKYFSLPDLNETTLKTIMIQLEENSSTKKSDAL